MNGLKWWCWKWKWTKLKYVEWNSWLGFLMVDWLISKEILTLKRCTGRAGAGAARIALQGNSNEYAAAERRERRSVGWRGEKPGRVRWYQTYSAVKLELVTAARNVPRNRAIYFAEKICLVMVRSSIFFQSAFVYHMVHKTFYIESKLLITVYILLHIFLNN